MQELFRKNLLRMAITTLLIAYATHASAQDYTELLPLKGRDLAAGQLQAIESTAIINHSRDDVFISWPLQPDSELSETPKTYKASSKQYWINTNGKQLQQGVKLHITAPGAIVKLSPRTDKNISVSVLPIMSTSQLTIIDSQGKTYSQQSAMARSATAAQLKNSAFPFSPGTVIFQLNETLGHGEFTLKAENISSQQQPFTLYVLDKNSDYELSVQTENDTVFSGQSLLAQIALTQNKFTHTINNTEAYLLSPVGKKFTVDYKSTKQGLVKINQVLDDLDGKNVGLWELHVIAKTTINGMPIQRNAKTSFAYSLPNAALNKTVLLSQNTQNDKVLTLSFGINAVSSGRFELRATLFATDSNKQQVPVMFANSAGWRAAGTSTLDLEFDLNKITENTLNPPFEIRDLRLLDQSRMMLLHRQQRALRFQ